MADDNLRRININVPNDQLAEWLLGPGCKAAVERVTAEIYSIYVSTLPEITGNLKAGANMYVDHGGWGADQDRWFGYVGNSALSYRNTKGKPYPRYIEYGKNGQGGQHQLLRAAEIVGGHLGSEGGVSIPGVHRTAHGLRSEKTGRFVANPLTRRRPGQHRRRRAQP